MVETYSKITYRFIAGIVELVGIIGVKNRGRPKYSIQEIKHDLVDLNTISDITLHKK